MHGNMPIQADTLRMGNGRDGVARGGGGLGTLGTDGRVGGYVEGGEKGGNWLLISYKGRQVMSDVCGPCTTQWDNAKCRQSPKSNTIPC